MMDVSDETDHNEEDVSKAMQGKVIGVIIPPPDIRAVVDKTAQFVARNGKSFEQRILGSGEGKTAKFNFMKQFDPYHAYYEQKIRFILFSIFKTNSEIYYISNDVGFKIRHILFLRQGI
jgi:hypothetical protein